MNLIFVAVFAASACLANGQENYSDDLKGEEINSTSPNEIITFEDKYAKYWPQIVIIKPMGLYPNSNIKGQPFAKKIKFYRPIATRPTTTRPNAIIPTTFTTSRPEKPNAIIQTTFTTSRPETTITTLSTTQALEISTAQVEEYESATTATDSESSCKTPSGGNGECISVYSCQPLLDLVNKQDRTRQDIDLLQKSQCGYQGNAPAVCCPKKSEPPPEPQGNTCYTPEGNLGKCVNLYSCTHLADMLKPPVPDENIAYVQKSRCVGPEQYSVCCGPNPDRTKDVVPGNCPSKMSTFPPDPRTECCGVDSRVGNKIVGGTATTVDQYPWLVMIEYEKDGVTKLLCGGALISGKYVLTAGHCVAGHVLDVGTPRRVRLGEYDIAHEGPDCTAVDGGGQDCTEGVTRIRIERTIPHPQYNPLHAQKRHDIALIRLQESATFTEFIRPICLPSQDVTLPQNIPENFTLFAAGWGAVSNRQSYSNVKLHVDLPFVSQDRCQPSYSLPGRNINLWKGQMCAGGINGKDSCKGDSGGPLMYEAGRISEVIGIVSFGPVPCGMEGIPGVYSKVYEYLDWIRSTIVA